MTDDDVYITRISAWAPGVCDSAGWDDWALDKREILSGSKGPDLSFAEPMFRRRLSQISKMTIQVIHDLMPFSDNVKIFFTSFRGELSRQFQINKMLIEEKALSPAAFSLSVFNAPVALASIALGLKGGYSAIFPANNSFFYSLKTTVAALHCGTAQEILFIYADEEVPQEYNGILDVNPKDVNPKAAAFAFLLTKNKNSCGVKLSLTEEQNPLEYLKRILLSGGIHVSS